mmetsp:Transcript_69580/g.137721  ORF Transcript_69580/g.137721 Transcript_69580/m.137721 type:complete len:315 (-) Transcript_69580:6-950(-)
MPYGSAALSPAVVVASIRHFSSVSLKICMRPEQEHAMQAMLDSSTSTCRVPPGNNLGTPSVVTEMSHQSAAMTAGSHQEVSAQDHVAKELAKQLLLGVDVTQKAAPGEWSALAEGAVAVQEPGTPSHVQEAEAEEDRCQVRVGREMADSLVKTLFEGLASSSNPTAGKVGEALRSAMRERAGAESVASFASDGRISALPSLVNAEEKEALVGILEKLLRDVGSDLPEGVIPLGWEQRRPRFIPPTIREGPNESAQEDGTRPPSNCSMASLTGPGLGRDAHSSGGVMEELLEEILLHLDEHVLARMQQSLAHPAV